MFEGIEDINCNNFISSLGKKNEIKFEDFNSISICQNQQNQLTFQNIEKNDMPEFCQSQGIYQINFFCNTFLSKEPNSLTLNNSYNIPKSFI